VFRAIVLGGLTADASNLLQAFYQPLHFPDAVVFDPFMGSGTTVGETLKLGARAIGRDINPVAYFAAKNALTKHSRERVVETFHEIERDVAPSIRRLYHTRLDDGETADVLYFFWVMTLWCPSCSGRVDLFSTYLFARHAYPQRYPKARAACPACGAIEVVRYDSDCTTCTSCGKWFDVRAGPAHGAKAVCPSCTYTFPIAEAVRRRSGPPDYRLYAKLVLMADGSKAYLRATADDEASYADAVKRLAVCADPYPIAPIQGGHNTDQILNYNYRHWHELFNGRQLLGLSLLAERIRSVDDPALRELFTCLFSGTLEFNNMFASYKGEGTGAVRHMFAHHILKPECMPIEANLWGTPRSSGSFSTLFRSRLLRALDYSQAPFEVRLANTTDRQSSYRVYDISFPLGHHVAGCYSEFDKGERLYLSCGASARTDLPSESVDLVVTDPPFFDNVHYSELADFFHIWQQYVLGSRSRDVVVSTRSANEVQSSDPVQFTGRLLEVFLECHRILKCDGLLIFTYNHSRDEGWQAVLDALVGAGFIVVATHRIKADMTGATPKQQANDPITLDMIIVCRRYEERLVLHITSDRAVSDAIVSGEGQVDRFTARGRQLSRNDVRMVVMAQVVKSLSQQGARTTSVTSLAACRAAIELAIGRICAVLDRQGLSRQADHGVA